MFDLICQKVKNDWGNQVLTLNMELNFGSNTGTQLLNLSNDALTDIDRFIIKLRKKYLQLDIETHANLVEYNIRLFALEEYYSHDDFLESLRLDLVELMQYMLEKFDLRCQLNGKGTLENVTQKVDFVYLNKGTQVEYKVVKSETLTGFGRVRKHQLILGGLTLLGTILICWTIYNIFLLPDHNLEHLLHKVI